MADCTLTNDEVAAMTSDGPDGLLYKQPFCSATREETCESYCTNACQASLISYEQIYRADLAGEGDCDCNACTCPGGFYDESNPDGNSGGNSSGNSGGADGSGDVDDDEEEDNWTMTTTFLAIAVAVTLAAAAAVYFMRSQQGSAIRRR